MAFTRPATGQTIQATDITQITDALEGVAGAANRLQITQVNDSSNFAGDFQNLDSTNSYGLRVRDSSSNVFATFALAAVTLAKKLVMTGLGTFTAAVNLLDIAATWNAAADTFNGIKVNITNTASAAASTLFDFQVASTSVFKLTALKAITHALGTVTAAIDQLTLTATWNAGAAAFNGILVSITNTASAATSRLIDLKVGGTSQFSVTTGGNTTLAGTLTVSGASATVNGVAVIPTSGQVMGAVGANRHVESGAVLCSSSADETVTFANPFASAPNVVSSVISYTAIAVVNTITATTFKVSAYDGAVRVAQYVEWIAEGPD